MTILWPKELIDEMVHYRWQCVVSVPLSSVGERLNVDQVRGKCCHNVLRQPEEQGLGSESGGRKQTSNCVGNFALGGGGGIDGRGGDGSIRTRKIERRCAGSGSSRFARGTVEHPHKSRRKDSRDHCGSLDVTKSGFQQANDLFALQTFGALSTLPERPELVGVRGVHRD